MEGANDETNIDEYQEQENLGDPNDLEGSPDANNEHSSKGDFAYKEVSEMSDLTEESYPDGVEILREGAKELENYDRLMEQTKKKLNIVGAAGDDDSTSIASTKPERSDEFLRNFFIKFGMKRTLDQFQQEWFELKAKGQLDTTKLPNIPEIYRVNQALSDELAVL